MKKNPSTGHVPYTDSGDGHVWNRPDGNFARCGGPEFCKDCASDREWVVSQLPSEIRSLVKEADQASYLLRSINFKGHAESVDALIAFVMRHYPEIRFTR